MRAAAIAAEAIDRATGRDEAARRIGAGDEDDDRSRIAVDGAAIVPLIGEGEVARAARFHDYRTGVRGERLDAVQGQGRRAVGAERKVRERRRVSLPQGRQRGGVEAERLHARDARGARREPVGASKQPFGAGEPWYGNSQGEPGESQETASRPVH